MLACASTTFSLDLGNTHCPQLKKTHGLSADECMQSCCGEGDACETWQWCEAGKACALGFWAQPGALSVGNDLAGWPKNTTIDVAEAACAASEVCVGITYHSNLLHPGATPLKFYLKSSGSASLTDPSWTRHVKASPGCYTGRLDSSCANATEGWSSHAVSRMPLYYYTIYTSFVAAERPNPIPQRVFRPLRPCTHAPDQKVGQSGRELSGCGGGRAAALRIHLSRGASIM